MKKFIFILLAITAVTFNSTAQDRFRVGLKAGLSTSQVEGDTYGGFHKAGAAGGIFVNAKFKEKWSAQMEIIFIQKGSKFVGDPENGDGRYYYMGLNYIEVPVLFQYHQKKFTFEIGPAFGYLISSQEFNQDGEIYMPVPFHSTEFSGDIGVSFQLFKNLSLNWRYSNSLLPIRSFRSGQSRWYNPGQRNNVLAFTLFYQFGGNEKSE